MNRNPMFITDGGNLPSYITEKSRVSIYTEAGGKNGNNASVYETAAQNFLTSELNDVKKNWENYKQIAGLK
jgi:hypothetical protein